MQERPSRLSSLDALRGLTVLLMIPVNAGMDFTQLPAWFKHAPSYGMNFADFIMPAFLVALGLSSSFSFKRRIERDGFGKTALHALLRYGFLFVAGSIGYFLVWQGRSWEVLQMLGATGALAFVFLFLAPIPRLFAALALLLIVEILRPLFFDASYRAWYDSGLGGPAGTFALASLSVAASAIGELVKNLAWKKRATWSALTGILCIGLGILASLYMGPNKHLLTPAYLLLSFGTTFVFWAFLEFPCAAWGDLPLLGPIGRNPLFGYMGSGILILVARAVISPEASAPLAWAATLGPLVIITFADLVLDRKKLWIRL